MAIVDDLVNLKKKLVTQRDDFLTRAAEIDDMLVKIDVLMARTLTQETSTPWSEMGITEAAHIYLKDNPGAYTTREMADALKARGVKSDATRFQATVYAVLRESPWFDFDGKLWTLSERGKRNT